jgi:short subunit dehydrogenase-like uncharacterized protein
MSRTHDLIVWGATGFTGRLVAEYLVTRHPEVRFALGGRSRERLEAVKRELSSHGEVAGVSVVVGDPSSLASMVEVASSTRVVAATAGPFMRYGRELVRACAAAGTHYADITGEPTFVRAAIDELHETAREKGARIVPCCGFDSIPSDLGVLTAHHALAERGSAIRSAELYLVKMRGGASGGTATTMLMLSAEAARDPAVRALLADPHALDPSGGPRAETREVFRASRGANGEWTAPFLMRAINARVVRRTNALLDYAYGESFTYDERIVVGRGPLAHVRASALALGLRFGVPALGIGPVRALATRVLPKPGEGPSREARERGRFVGEVRAKGTGGATVRVTIRSEQDPGYGETAKMLGEAALALAFDEARLPRRAGVLTPASGIGMPLVERLRKERMTFDVE